MVRDDEFTDLIDRVQSGCQQSVGVLLNRYGPYILMEVRRRLNRRLRSKFDSLDFVQDVWTSFFADAPTKYAFQDPADLIALLTKMARNKVSQTVRVRLKRQKYNVNRERPLDPDPDDMPGMRLDLVTPSEIIMSREAWESVLERQPLVHRRILSLLREGREPASIAEELQISVRTVRRVIQKNLPGIAS